MYGFDGKIVWENGNLELQMGDKAGIHYIPRYNKEQESIYVLGEEKIHVLDVSQGVALREENLGANPETPLYIKKDPLIGMRYYLYYGTFSRKVICVNSDNLKVRWDNFKAEGVPAAILSTKAKDEAVIIGCRDDAGSLYAVDFREGKLISQIKLGSPVVLPFKEYESRILIALGSGSIVCYDIPSNKIVWQSPTLTEGPKEQIVALEIVKDKIITVVNSEPSRVEILDIEKDGAKVGKLPSFEPAFSDTVKACAFDGKSRIYFVTAGIDELQPGIWAYDFSQKRIVWQYFSKGLDLYSPVIKDNHVFIVSKDGRLIHFVNSD
jgi:outer membrane protein assembly factor BamB